MPAVSIGEIVDFVGGEFAGSRDATISSVAPLVAADATQLSFLSNRKYAAELAATKAGAIAFSRTGDPNVGEFADAVVLFKAGDVPEDVFG